MIGKMGSSSIYGDCNSHVFNFLAKSLEPRYQKFTTQTAKKFLFYTSHGSLINSVLRNFMLIEYLIFLSFLLYLFTSPAPRTWVLVSTEIEDI